MKFVLGIDTSNYTTSVALLDVETNIVYQTKRLLPVSSGQLGLRQSDAVFHHTKQLPKLIEDLFQKLAGDIVAIGASNKPCSKDGSYMPCFLVGEGFARSFGAIRSIPAYYFTHQQGHIAAAAFGSKQTGMLKNPFFAFHISGGTTDLLLVKPDRDTIIQCQCIASSLDLKAGQLIDRVGGKLGLDFPAGPALDNLANTLPDYQPKGIRPSIENGNCHLSGIENQCQKLIEEQKPANEVANFCLYSILEAISFMAREAVEKYGDYPFLFAGGVMSNTLLKEKLTQRFHGFFSDPVYSSDNAVGIAWLASQKEFLI